MWTMRSSGWLIRLWIVVLGSCNRDRRHQMVKVEIARHHHQMERVEIVRHHRMEKAVLVVLDRRILWKD